MSPELPDSPARRASEATAVPILEFGRGWMMNPDTAAKGAELGFEGFGFWVNGRAGALGEVSSEVAAAAIGVMAPDLVAKYWRCSDDVSPFDAAHAYAEAAAEWGRNVLADVDSVRLERLCDLGDRLAEAALPAVGLIFTGWRRLERPADPAGQATVVLNVLRELRGGAHLSALQSAGLTPHGAIMSFVADQIRGGANGSERFGWAAPHPEPDVDARARAEVYTTAACLHAYNALDAAEAGEFIDLVSEARAAMDTLAS